MVWAISFVVLRQASDTYVLPKIQAWEARNEASEYIASNRYLSLLAARHPEIREQFSDLMDDLTRKGATKDKARAAGRELGRRLLSYFFQVSPLCF